MVTITANGLIDIDGTLLNGNAYFNNIDLPIVNGQVSGSVASGTYNNVQINSENNTLVTLQNVVLNDGETYDLAVAGNGGWCVASGGRWFPLGNEAGDFIEVQGDTALPTVPSSGQVITITNEGPDGHLSGTPNPVGNAQTAPGSALPLASKSTVEIRFDGYAWRVLADSTSPQ